MSVIAEGPIHQAPARTLPGPLSRLQSALVWLTLASSFYVLIEPAPTDAVFGLALVTFFSSGLRFNAAIAPLIFFLLLYNLGGMLSYLQIFGDSKALQFVETSAYMSIAAIFFASYISEDSVHRAAIIRNGWIVAGFIASVFGIAGYLKIGGFIGGSPDYRDAALSRAVGLFKDPNVFSTFIIFPAILLIQGFMLGEQRHKLFSAIGLLTILSALFLAFSRGAWISFIAAAMLLVSLTFILVPPSAVKMPSAKMRTRIVLFFVGALLFFLAMLVVLLSFQHIRELFMDRFTLVKEYDGGETGRFANQLNSIPLLLQQPMGFGPLQFGNIFRFAPHNVYVNAFSSYGWLGGVSYFVLVVLSIWAGIKAILIRSPWQNFAIAVFCPLLTTIFQGIQIDTDHWRHFYWLLGLNWGLLAASLNYKAGYSAQRKNENNGQYVKRKIQD